jgi:hypothetical protein
VTSPPAILSDILRDGLIGLSNADRLALLDVPTLTEATQRLVRRILDRPSWVTDHSPHLGGCMVAFGVDGLAIDGLAVNGPAAHGHGSFAALVVPLFDNAQWKANVLSGPDAPTAGTEFFEQNFNARFALLYGLGLNAHIASALDVLTDPDTAMPNRSSLRQAAVLSWWQARMDSGYTPATARTMLALTASPHVAALIEWLPDGTPGPAQPTISTA